MHHTMKLTSTFLRTLTPKLFLLAVLLGSTLATVHTTAAHAAKGSPSPTPALAVADVAIDDSDLFVTLFADAADGGIGIEILIDVSRTGTTIATVPATIPSGGGRFDVFVPNITAAIPLHGYAYTVRVRLPGGGDVATPFPMRQRLRCPDPSTCRVEAWPGVTTTSRTLPVPAALAEALRGATTTVQLQQLARSRPALRGDLYTLLDELDGPPAGTGTALKGQAIGQPGTPAGCFCGWVVGIEMSGLARLVSVVDEGFAIEPGLESSFASMKIDFLCADLSNLPGHQVELPDGSQLQAYQLADLPLCSHSCPTSVEFEARSTIGAAAGGGSDDWVFGSTTMADGSARLDWLVGGQLSTLGSASASFTSAPLDDPRAPDKDRAGVLQVAQPLTAPTEATLRAVLDAESWSSNDDGWSHGEGAVSTSTRLKATMSTSCLLQKATETAEIEPFLTQCCKDYVSLLDGNP